MFIATGNLEAYSEQQLVDCDTEEQNGCRGGLYNDAYDFIINDHPLVPNDLYPYESKKGDCRYNRAEGKGSVKSYV